MISPLKKTAMNEQIAQARALYPIDDIPLSIPEKQEIDEHFPMIHPCAVPLGNRVLIQIRAPREKIGSIYVPGSMEEEQLYQEQIGKVVAIGPTCFHAASTGTPWPEGSWFTLGDFVRIPRFGGDKQWTREDKNGRRALFVFFRDFDIIGKVIGNPLDVKGYV